jgi:hypothetical protein
MVVLALLTLFAVVGISFVYYANAGAQVSQLVKDAEDAKRPDIDPEMLAAFFLGQLITDTKDDESGVYSALRGHSLARTKYGYNYRRVPTDPDLLNNLAYDGTGRLHTYDPTPLAGTTRPYGRPAMNPFGPAYIGMAQYPQQIDDYNLINYMFFRDDPQIPPQFVFLRDPERYAKPGEPPWRNRTGDPTQPPKDYVGGGNAPYTYPDINSVFLGAVTADARLLTQSFHRDWVFRDQRLDPAIKALQVNSTRLNDPTYINDPRQFNQNWLSPHGKYLTLRPRPIDQLLPGETFPPNRPFFPYPEDATGDVKNLIGAPGGNDSIWIDLGFPVMVAPDGRKYKALFAPLIVDLDNRVNLNTAGNIRGSVIEPTTGNRIRAHAVNQGWGPWSVDLSQIFYMPPSLLPPPPNEWQNLFTGTPQPPIPGRYRVPGLLNGSAMLGFRPHFYARVDWDEWFKEGMNDMPTTAVDLTKRLDGGMPANRYSPFVSFDPVSPQPNGTRGWQDGNPGESLGHASLYNVFRPTVGTRRFPLSDMEALLRFDDTGSLAFTSELLRLCPHTFLTGWLPTDPNDRPARRRNLVTLRSFDRDCPGVSPWLALYGDKTSNYGNGGYRLAPGNKYPTGSPAAFPEAIMVTPPATTATPPGDFAADWRAITACLERLDLNRPLPPYPAPTGGLIDISNPQSPTTKAFQAAELARQQLAEDIYLRLIAVTGAYNPFATVLQGIPEDQQVNSLRALAQLAVNIVDFIDEDDYMTPFNFGALGDQAFLNYVRSLPAQRQKEFWVFGTELPHLVLNEAYAEFDTARQVGTQWKSVVRVWVELHNPLHPDATLLSSEGGAARLARPDRMAQGSYQILLCKHDPSSNPTNPDNLPLFRKPENVLGDPFMPPLAGTADFTNTPPRLLVQPAAGRQGSGNPTAGNEGYYVIGPGPLGTREPDLMRPAMGQMSYDAPALDQQGRPATSNTGRPEAPTVLLRRLACPYLPAQQDPSLPFYNPYITVDYMEDVNIAVGSPEDPDTMDRDENLLNGGHRIRRENEKRSSGDNPRLHYSDGRREPYAGLKGSLKRISASNDNRLRALQTGGAADEPNHTFWRSNSNAMPDPPINKPFHWLYHLDRPLISPAELLQVSAFKPHELTQEFMEQRNRDSAVPYHHVVPWFDQDQAAGSGNSHRLFRLFEFVGTRSRAAGLEAASIPNERIPNPLEVMEPNPPTQPPNRLRAQTLSWLTTSGAPATIRVGDVLVLNKGLPTHENVRVGAILQSGPGQPFVIVLANPLLKNIPGPVRVELTTLGDRIPGKINLNTVWDHETFYAGCAGSPSNNYDQEQPPNPKFSQLVFNEIVGLRSGNLGANESNFTITGSDRPFLGMAVGTFHDQPTQEHQFPGRGIIDTFFRPRPGGTAQKLFEIWSQQDQDKTHPFQKWQMLTRMFNNFTTRSNVFAVWVTVGFFEVIDAESRPVKLGAEIGRAENRHVRHRMFAIVDRSNLRMPSQIGGIAPAPAGLPVYGPGTETVPLTAVQALIPAPPRPAFALDRSLPPQRMDWAINIGDYVVFNYGRPNQETVLVEGMNRTVNPNTITVTFKQPHNRFAAGDPNTETVSVFVVPGNPGPTDRFDPRDPIFSEVVPYLSVID